MAYIGDDLTDIPILNRIGFSIAVADAPLKLKEQVDYVTKKEEGRGAVREAIELILKAQGKKSQLMKI